MKKRNVYSLLFATVLIVLGAGGARAGDTFNRPGPYLGLGAAGGLSDFGGAFDRFGDSYGFNFRGGYRFNDYLAIEGLFEYMDDFGHSRTSANERVKASASIQTNNFAVQTKVIIPTGMSQFQPFLSGGIGFLNANGAGKLRVGSVTVEDRRAPSATEFAGRVDGGVDYFFTPAVSAFVGAGYVIPTDQLSDLSYISLSAGVKYNF
jgi:hypothetical protein